MPEPVEYDQAAAGNIAMESVRIVRRNEPVAPAPQNQGRNVQRGDTLRVDAGRRLRKPLRQRAPVALAQGEFEVTIDEFRRDFARVGVDVAQAGFDHAARQRELHQPVQQRDSGDAKSERKRHRLERIAGRVDENQFFHARRMCQRRFPRDLAAEGVARKHAARYPERIQHGGDEVHIALDAVVCIRRRAGQADARQIEADYTPVRLELRGPAVPGVQAGRSTVQQHDRNRIGARAFVAQMHAHALHIDEGGRCWRPARLEFG